jgi:hypothetical protein
VRARPGWLAALVAVLVVAAVLAVDTVAPPATPAAPVTGSTAAATPVAGAAVCAVGTSSESTTTTVTMAGADTARTQPASVELDVLDEGEVVLASSVQLFAGASMRATPELGDTGAPVVRWRDAPVAVSREWRIEEDEELPDVTIAGPCPSSTSGRWIVPGMSTSGGDEATLRLVNPYRSAATLAVTFLSPEGLESPLALRNVSVPGRSVRTLTVNEFLPERTDLSAIVDVASGRLVVEGVQLSRSAIGGVDGGSLLAAAPETAEEWTIPTVRDGGGAASWLWIANPTQRTAEVELTLHTAEGGIVPDGLAATTVAPGSLQRVDLAGTFPEDTQVAAITARSNGTPVVVSAGTTVSADDPQDTATIVQLGAPAPDSAWTISGGATGGRTESLRLVNPTGERAIVDVTLVAGVSSLEPAELQAIELGPGASEELVLDELLAGAGSWTAFVEASGSRVVVGRSGARTEDGEGALRAVAGIGSPTATWQVSGTGLVAQQRDGLVRTLGTTGGVVPRDPLDGFTDEAPGVDAPVPDDEPLDEPPSDLGEVDPPGDDPAGDGSPDDGSEDDGAEDDGADGDGDDDADPADGEGTDDV